MQGNNQCFLLARGSLARTRQVSPAWQEPVPASPSHLHRQICLLGRAGAGWMCPSCAWGGMGMPKPPLKVQPAAAAQPSLVRGADMWQWHSRGSTARSEMPRLPGTGPLLRVLHRPAGSQQLLDSCPSITRGK